MKKHHLIASAAVFATLTASATLTRLVPEHGTSKLFTLKSDADREYRVSFYRPDVFRVEAALKSFVMEGTNKVERYDYADKHNNPTNAQILVETWAEDKSGVKFADKDGFFVFTTSEIIVSFDKTNETMSVSAWRGEDPIFEEAQRLEFTTNSCTQTIASDADEKIWGGGQQLGRLMHKGRKISIACDFNWSDGGAPNPAPFMISSRGWGMLRHTFAPGAYDFTAEDKSLLTHDEGRFDAFYFIGDFATVLDRYTEATGRPNFLPVWGLELGDADAYMTREKDTKYPKQEKDGSFTETTPDALKVAQRYREDDLPGGWLLVNDGYGCGYTELASVCDGLKQLGFHTGLWTEGKLDRIAWEVGTAGTRIQKLDVAWTCQGGAQYRYQYPLQCNKDTYLGFTTNANARAFCWTVLGWAGTQRYGICWAGDEYGGWDLIKYMIPGVTGSAMSGQAYATTDVDGIFGGSSETYLRDLQWKCWTTAMYVMNGWSDVNKSPWSYPEPYKSHIRAALKHKIRMTPFLYTLMRGSWETGAPIVRPMAWNYPYDPECLDESTMYQFMVGTDILVAPVYTPEKLNKGWWRKGIYLPYGDWYDYNDGRRVKGGQWLKAYPIDLGKIPVFVRAGAILPMYDEALTMSGADKTRLTFDIWPGDIAGGLNHTRVYEDDGESLDYAKGAWREKFVLAEMYGALDFPDTMSDMTVSIAPGEFGGYEGAPEKRVYLFDIHTQAEPAQVLVDGKEVMLLSTTKCVKDLFENVKEGWWYDPDDKFGTLHVKLLPRGDEESLQLKIRFPAELVDRVDTPDYPVPSEAEAEELAAGISTNAVDLLRNRSIVDGLDMVVTNGLTVVQKPEPFYSKIRGHVATHKDNDPAARFTFRIFAGNHVAGRKQIFERANMKGNDAPQLIEVNLPTDVQKVEYEFTADDESEASKNARGVWKKVEYIAE
ncbi:MAG: DUF5110 domain-containing protein [Kiritimatiellae bacterium]|nr:DUF5110 domain-containing protein [Kiritimatiellia bacterium]